MEALTIVPFVFLGLIVVLFIWAIIFMKALKKDKQRLTSIFADEKDQMKQEQLYMDMAQSYENKGDKDKALEYYFLYQRKFPNNPEVFYKIGTLLKSKSPEEAAEYLERAASLGHQKAIEELKKAKDTSQEETGKTSDTESDKKDMTDTNV